MKLYTLLREWIDAILTGIHYGTGGGWIELRGEETE